MRYITDTYRNLGLQQHTPLMCKISVSATQIQIFKSHVDVQYLYQQTSPYMENLTDKQNYLNAYESKDLMLIC